MKGSREDAKTRSESGIILARRCAEEVLMERITPLIGKDYSNKIPALRQRIAAVRAGEGDNLPEVKSAVLMEQYLRAFAASRESK